MNRSSRLLKAGRSAAKAREAFGVADSAPVAPIQTREKLPLVLRLSPQAIRRDLAAVDGVNGIALISLPSALRTGQLTVIIASTRTRPAAFGMSSKPSSP